MISGLTCFTSYFFLVHALYKAEERSARLKEGRRLSTPQTAVGGGAQPSRRISNLPQPSSQHHDPAGLQPSPAQGAPVATTTAAVQTTGSVRVIAINGSGGGNTCRSVSKRTKASSRRKSTDRTTRLLIVLLVLFLLTEFPQVSSRDTTGSEGGRGRGSSRGQKLKGFF